jgi:hypothetical protein
MYGPHWKGRPTLEGDLENFRNNGLSKGFDNTLRLNTDDPPTDVPEIVVKATLGMYVSMMGEKFFDTYYRCGVGNPGGITERGKTITLSDLHAVYNAWQLIRHIPEADTIVEIGPGYGALAAILRELYPDAEIVLVDLPEHRPVTEHYLSETVGLDNITFTTELPPRADIAIALRCMMEMPPSEINKYFDWIQNEDVEWFYLINRYFKCNVTKWYPFDNYWTPMISRNDYLTGVLHEFLLKRSTKPSDVLKNQLETLPPYIYGEDGIVWMKGTMTMAGVPNGV